jgi:signal transduction histidine kinase
VAAAGRRVVVSLVGLRRTASVRKSAGLIQRVAAAGRRVAGAPSGPLAIAGALGLLAVVEVTLRGGAGPILPIAVVLALGATMPLALARTQVAASVLAIGTAMVLTVAFAQVRPLITGSGVVALLAACYLLGRRRPWRSAAVPLLPLAAYALPMPFFHGGGRSLAWLLLALAVAAVAAGLGTSARAEAARRNASSRAIADTLLEHAARGERARIARELHDVVAHHISMIVVQAETARLTTRGMPAEGARHLLAIGDTARAALTEMRRLLGVLREDAGPEPRARTPQPGLDQLNTLIDEARDSAGTSTRLIVRGRVAPMDPGIQLTAYRIIQEALTNARRHAPGAAVDVELDYTADALRIRVRDNGPGPPRAGPTAPTAPAAAGPATRPERPGRHRGALAAVSGDAGHGLLGMRERAATVGGTLRIGEGPVGGFVVEAVLPAPAEVE